MKSPKGNLQVAAVFLTLGIHVYAGEYRISESICGSNYPVTGSNNNTIVYTEPIPALKECKVKFYKSVNFGFDRLCFMMKKFNLQACEMQLLLYDDSIFPIKTYSCNNLVSRLPEVYCTTRTSLSIGIKDLDSTNSYKTRDIQVEFYLANSQQKPIYSISERICGSSYQVMGATNNILLYTEPIPALKECKVVFYRSVANEIDRLCFIMKRFNLQACELQLMLYDGSVFPSKTYTCNDLGSGSLSEPYCTRSSSLIIGVNDLDLSSIFKTRDLLMEIYLENSIHNSGQEETEASAESGLDNAVVMAAAIAGSCAFLGLVCMIGIAVACRRRRRASQRSSEGYSSPSAAGQSVTHAEQPQHDGFQMQPGSWPQTGNTSQTGHQQAPQYQPQPPGYKQNTEYHPHPSSEARITPTAPPPDFDDPPPPYPGI